MSLRHGRQLVSIPESIAHTRDKFYMARRHVVAGRTDRRNLS